MKDLGFFQKIGKMLKTYMSDYEKSSVMKKAGIIKRALTIKNICHSYVINAPQRNGSRIKVSKGAKIRNRYNQVPHQTQDTNGKVTNSELNTTNQSQEVSPFPAGDTFVESYLLYMRYAPDTISLDTRLQWPKMVGNSLSSKDAFIGQI